MFVLIVAAAIFAYAVRVERAKKAEAIAIAAKSGIHFADVLESRRLSQVRFKNVSRILCYVIS